MNNWIKSILIGSGFVIAYFLLVNTSHIKPKPSYLAHYVVKISNEKTSTAGIEEVINQTLPVLKKRMTAAGFESSIKRKGSDLVEVIVAHTDDTLLTRRMIETNNKLEFRELYMLTELMSSIESASKTWEVYFPRDKLSNFPNDKSIFSLIGFSVDEKGRPVDNGVIGRTMEKDTPLVNKFFSDSGILKSFPGDIEFCYGPTESTGSPGNKQNLYSIYAIKTKMQGTVLTNEYIEYASSEDGNYKKRGLTFQFNEAGSRIWEQLTSDNKGRYIAIIIDKKVISAPHVESAISGGTTSLHGDFKKDEVDLLALQLTSGYIPAHLSVVQQEVTPEKSPYFTKNLLWPALLFIVAGGLSFAIFSALKRN